MTDAQQWLDTNFQPVNPTGIKRTDIVNLTITRNTATGIISWLYSLISGINERRTITGKLTGELNLNGFTNLQTLDCQNNRLTSLNVSGNNSLRNLTCFGNHDLKTITGLESLTSLRVIDCGNISNSHVDLRPINQLRNEVKRVFLTGINAIDANNPNDKAAIIVGAINNFVARSTLDNRNTIIIAIRANYGRNSIIWAQGQLSEILNTLRSDNNVVRELGNSSILTNASSNTAIIVASNVTGNHEIGYNNLMNREITACQQVIDAPQEVAIPQEQKDQAQQEIVIYQAKIEQIKPWL
jgi:hypothetical protein